MRVVIKLLKSTLLFLFVIIMSVGCKKNINDLVLLEIKSRQDYLIDSTGQSLYLSHVTSVKKLDKDNFLIVDGKEENIYITDMELKLKEKISFSGLASMGIYAIMDGALKSDSLYIIDGGPFIKVMDIKTSQVDYLNKNIDINLQYLRNLVVTDTAIFAGMRTVNPSMQDMSKVIIGAVFSRTGSVIRTFQVQKNNLNYPVKVSESSFVSVYKDYIYISFYISKKVFVFRHTGELLAEYDLQMDADSWSPPKENSRGGIIARPVCGRGLEIDSCGHVFHVIAKSQQKGIIINEYDAKLKIIKQYSIKSPGGAFFEAIPYRKYFLLFNGFNSEICTLVHK